MIDTNRVCVIDLNFKVKCESTIKHDAVRKKKTGLFLHCNPQKYEHVKNLCGIISVAAPKSDQTGTYKKITVQTTGSLSVIQMTTAYNRAFDLSRIT